MCVMALRADDNGFIIGERRLKEISSGINQTKDNTQEILDVLTDSLLDIKKGYESGSRAIVDTFKQTERRRARDADAPVIKAQADRQEKTSRAIDTNVRKVVEASQDIARNTKRAIDAENGVNARTSTSGRTTARDADAVDTSSVKYRAEKSRERDANGRFIGSGSTSESRSVFGKLKDLVSDVSGGGNVGDARGLDPTIDALGELKDLVSPVGGVFKRMSVKAAGVFAGRIRKRGMDEALPVEQVKANKEQQRHDVRRNKLLERLIDAVRRNKPKGGLFDSLTKGGGGLLRLLMGGGKAVLKRIPLLGALFGGGMLAKDWGKLDNAGKGKGVGSVVGGVGGAIVGSLLGPAGTLAGGALGAYLGGIFGKKVGEWTDSLKGVDFGKLFTDTLNEIFSFAKNAAGAVANTAMIPFRATQGVAGQAWDAVSGAYSSAKNYVSDKLGFGDTATGKYAPLLDMIAEGEARGGAFGTSGYNAIYSGAKVKPGKDVSKMTVGEVKAYQQQLIKAGSKSTAVGRYQFIHNKGAFGKMAAEAGIKDTDIFDAATQDKLAVHYLGGEKQLNKMIENKDYAKLTNKTAQQWASMKNTRGVGNYDGDGLNKARHGGLSAVSAAAEKIRLGETTKPAQEAKKPAQEASIPAAKKPAKTAAVLKTNTPRPAAIKVPAVTPELAKIGSKKTGGSKGPTGDSFMSQGVTDRNLAHILAGGLGYREQ